jgi:hypothetical protein
MSIQNTSGRVFDDAWVWRVVQYCVNGVTAGVTVTSGYSSLNALMICSIAGCWSGSQKP